MSLERDSESFQFFLLIKKTAERDTLKGGSLHGGTRVFFILRGQKATFRSRTCQLRSSSHPNYPSHLLMGLGESRISAYGELANEVCCLISREAQYFFIKIKKYISRSAVFFIKIKKYIDIYLHHPARTPPLPSVLPRIYRCIFFYFPPPF